MKLAVTLLTLTALLVSTVSFADSDSIRVIYGKDNRRDVYNVYDNQLRSFAKATAGMVENYALQSNYNSTYRMSNTDSLADSHNLCSTEKFASQPTLARCTGFLIDDDVLVTAGHCYEGNQWGPSACASFSWVFDLKMENSTRINTKKIPSNNIYRCKKVIKMAKDEPTEISRNNYNFGKDYAIIKLDRPVRGRRPLDIRRSGKIHSNADLVVIGHPSGLPTKIADGAWVQVNNKSDYFTANMDSFHGNSGSPVINAKTGLVEGILVRGKADYVPSDSNNPNSCMVVNTCANSRGNCTAGAEVLDGEQATRISVILPYL